MNFVSFIKTSCVPVHMEMVMLIPEWKHHNPPVYIITLGKLENMKHFTVGWVLGYINGILR